MATPGTIISGVGHVGLIGWLIVGWGLTSEPLDIQTMDVSVISGEDFEQMRAAATPEPGDADPTAPVPPVIEDNTPPPPAQEEPTEIAPPPEPVEPPESEAPPPAPPPPPPETEVTDAPPVEPAPPVAPPPTPDVEVSEQPTPPQAPTVASQITAPPPPDANIDDVVREEVVPDDTDDAPVIEEQDDPTAPIESTTAIIPEDFAPTTSVRPAARPSRPRLPQETEVVQEEPAQTQEEPAPAQAEPEVDTSVDDLLADIQDDESQNEPASAPAVPFGQALSGSESGSFASSIGDKWIVGTGSEAANITVVVRFSVGRDRKVVGDVVQVSASEGSRSAQEAAFSAARRAILRDSAEGGLSLPEDKYDLWKDMEITFDPSSMRLR